MTTLWIYYPDHWQFYHKVTFDGPNKIILINEGVTEIDVQRDLYSAWKEWFDHQNPDDLVNAAYLYAMRSVGGDPIPGGTLGATYFLSNGWRIKPWSGSYRLTVTGNLYTEEGDSPYLDADGNLNNVFIQSNVSNLVSNTGIGTVEEVADAVWDADKDDHTIDNTFGKSVQTTEKRAGLIPGLY